jgi:hypothetical protein
MSQEQRTRAVYAFLETVIVRVYDLEAEQYVDTKDFISKNFVE